MAYLRVCQATSRPRPRVARRLALDGTTNRPRPQARRGRSRVRWRVGADPSTASHAARMLRDERARLLDAELVRLDGIRAHRGVTAGR